MPTDAPAPKTTMNLRVSVDLDEQLTWGELRRFVALGAEKSPDDFVAYDLDEEGRVSALLNYVEPSDL